MAKLVSFLACNLMTILVFSSPLLAATPTEIVRNSQVSRLDRLNVMYSENAKRFDSHNRYVANYLVNQSFSKLQLTFIEQLKSEKAIKEVLLVENDFKSNLWVKLHLITDENNNFLAFYYEKSQYADQEEESFLRFYHIGQLDSGLKFIRVMNTHALQVRGFYFKAESGGTLQLNYPLDIKESRWGTLNLFLMKKDNHWSLYTVNYAAVKRLWISIWMQLFPPNGGISRVDIY